MFINNINCNKIQQILEKQNKNKIKTKQIKDNKKRLMSFVFTICIWIFGKLHLKLDQKKQTKKDTKYKIKEKMKLNWCLQMNELNETRKKKDFLKLNHYKLYPFRIIMKFHFTELFNKCIQKQ